MLADLSEQEQLKIINEVEEKYSKFLNPNFDASIFLKCRDNFALTEHIESVKIFDMDDAPINPIFTIAIPTYNRYETLKEGINSAINQVTDEKYEIIVIENVDDFDLKTPAQEMLEKEYRGKLTYFKNKENLGMFGNWNRCLTLAQGQWVCILHSDDMITNSYIEEMKKAISNVPQSTILIGCLEKLFGTKATNISYYDQVFCSKDTLKKRVKNLIFGDNKYFNYLHSQYIFKFIPPNAVLHNKEKSTKIGGYNPDEYPIADNFFHTRAYLNGGACVYLKYLQKRRLENNEGLNPRTQMAYCYIGTSFFLGLFPTKIANTVAWNYLKDRFTPLPHTIQEYLRKRFLFLDNKNKKISYYQRLYYFRFFLNTRKWLSCFIPQKTTIPRAMLSGEISNCTIIFPSEHLEYSGGKDNFSLTDIFGTHHRHFHPYRYQTKDFSVYTLPQAFCFTNNEIVFTKTKNYLIEQTSYQHHPLDYPTTINSKTKEKIIKIINLLRKIRISLYLFFAQDKKANVALLTRQDVEWCYGHFIRDVIGGYYQIYMFEKMTHFQIDYYILPCNKNFQIEMYNKLGIPREKIIPSESNTVLKANNIVIPTILSNFEIVDYRGYIHTRNYIWPSFIKNMYFDLLKIDTKPYKKIFLKRPINSNRNFTNYEEVEKIFQDYGYQVVLPDTLSIDQQISLFSKAMVIASMHGSGLNNLLFAQDNIYVFEIFSEYYHNNHPQAIAILKKCKYFYLVGETKDISCHPQQEDAYINPKALRQALNIIETKMHEECKNFN